MMDPIPWNVTVICEMFQTSWQVGIHLMNGDLGNHSVGPRFLSDQ